ncbi:hypothetical protein [Archangium sp.]|jgi:hypothetical protein|uniref:hypothetical protein n=1 Tax=Archangium sp. TaxID=1872627 RepID=UPI002ED7C8C2
MAILVGICLFFFVIALTIIFGGISRVGDKRVALEGRATAEQRLPTDVERDAYGY